MAYGPAETLIGVALFAAPGFAWAWWAGRSLDRPKRFALGVLLAFTLLPAVLYLLNLLFGLPVRLGTMATLAVALTLAGVSAGLAGPLRERLVA